MFDRLRAWLADLFSRETQSTSAADDEDVCSVCGTPLAPADDTCSLCGASRTNPAADEPAAGPTPERVEDPTTDDVAEQLAELRDQKED